MKQGSQNAPIIAARRRSWLVQRKIKRRKQSINPASRPNASRFATYPPSRLGRGLCRAASPTKQRSGRFPHCSLSPDLSGERVGVRGQRNALRNRVNRREVPTSSTLLALRNRFYRREAPTSPNHPRIAESLLWTRRLPLTQPSLPSELGGKVFYFLTCRQSNMPAISSSPIPALAPRISASRWFCRKAVRLRRESVVRNTHAQRR